MARERKDVLIRMPAELKRDLAREVEAAEGSDDLTVVAREELPETVRFWERRGVVTAVARTPWRSASSRPASPSPSSRAAAEGARPAPRVTCSSVCLRR